jgi:penicillin-binding protein 1A
MAKAKKQSNHFLKRFWIIAAILFMLPVLFIITVAIFGNLPDFKKLENPDTPLATRIMSSDGVVLGKFYNANRTLVDFEDLSPKLVNALISTEDVRFYKHSGVDFSRLFTIPFYNLVGKKQGASTLSQQLARNLFPRQKMNKFKIIWRKVEEQITAIKLERLYTKEEILAMYLNTVEFNNNAVGINSASHIYFDKGPDKLSTIEAAMLVGMLKNPTLYDPVRRPEIALRRRNTVLGQMKKNDALSEADFNKLKLNGLGLDYHPESHNDGMAAYLREYLRQWVKPWAVEHGVDIYKDGLTIYTTIDSRLQKYAEESVAEQLKPMQKQLFSQYKNSNTKPWSESPEILNTCMKQSDRYHMMKRDDASDEQITKAFYKPVHMKVFSYRGDVDTTMSPLDSIKYNLYYLHTGFMAMEPNTGHVKVWVGGINYKYFKYDHVTSNRQVGSTFKPFVYATAIMNGYSPCQKVWNTPVVFEKYNNWTPQNADKLFDGEQMTLAKGLATSTNRITAWVMKQVGPEPVVSLAQRMGIKSKLDPVPSLCLGTADLSVYEMVSAYNTFNNKGVYIEPIVVTKIEDKNGNVMQEFIPKTVDALDEMKDYVMINMLKGVCNGHLWGTATRLRSRYNLRGPMAGKTGTTQNHSDAWFMGLIPQLTGGVWVGGEERAIHFTSMNYGQGAALALPIWGYFLQKVYADKTLGIDPNKDWEKPAGDIGIEMDCDKYETTKPVDEGQRERTILE